MANYREIKNLKIQLLEELDLIDKNPQAGLEIFIEYDYLLNTDFNWLIESIRKSIIESLAISPKKRHELVLTFRICQASSENSILLIITLGIISDFLKDIVKELIKIGYKKLKEKTDGGDFTIDSRENIRKLRIRPVTIKDNKIKYDANEKNYIIIERKRDDDSPKWIRY